MEFRQMHLQSNHNHLHFSIRIKSRICINF